MTAYALVDLSGAPLCPGIWPTATETVLFALWCGFTEFMWVSVEVMS
jgi:hypothetical protein